MGGRAKAIGIVIALTLIAFIFLTYPTTVVEKSLIISVGEENIDFKIQGFRDTLKIVIEYNLTGVFNISILKGDKSIWNQARSSLNYKGTEIFTIKINGSGDYTLNIQVLGKLEANIKVIAFNSIYASIT